MKYKKVSPSEVGKWKQYISAASAAKNLNCGIKKKLLRSD
jgi:hypothetical protein